MNVTLLHPFTPAAAGVVESSVPLYHSQPHRKSFEMLAGQSTYDCSIQYFTTKFRTYALNGNGVTTEFFPVTWKWNGDHKKWKKQASRSCYAKYNKDCPDVTIINMSGHSSPFSFQLSKLIKSKGKKYIAMLGGQHYTNASWIDDYYRNAHHLLVHTKLQREKMLGMEMFRGLDIQVFPLGVDCSFFSPPQDQGNRSYISLLYVGRIIEWKRVHLAIEMLNRLKALGQDKAQLKIVGPVVSDTYFISLKEMVKKYDLENQVVFMGYQDHNKIKDILQQSDILLLPSENETFGMVIVESMACGVPVAGVRGGHGPDEVIADGVNGVLTSAEEYVEAVTNFLMRDKHQLNQVKQAARQTALAHFSIDETFKVLQRSVNDCLR